MLQNHFSIATSIGGMLFIALLSSSLRGEDTLASADRLWRTGRYEEAVESYRQIQQQHPVPAVLGIVRCRVAVGKDAEAEKTLREVVEKHPDSADLQGELALMVFRRGDYAGAKKSVDAALELNEDQLAARWVAAELHRVGGRMEEAKTAYRWFVRYYNRAQKQITKPEQLHWIGLAAAQYARWGRNSRQFNFLVNTLYPDALKLETNYWPARLEAARLFLEKYNTPDAVDEINAGLAINANAAELHAARAQVALQTYDLDAANQAIRRALEINPRLLHAHQLKADVLLRMTSDHVVEAIEVLQEARKLNEVDEETLGRLAAAYGLHDGLKTDPAGTRMGKLIEEASKRNEHCGRFFFSLAATLDAARKFPFAAQYYELAHRRMPELVGTRGQLGMMYMRLGEEVKAADLLKESFEIDPFNIRVKNTLAVLDVLQGYAVLETEHFVIRFDRGQDELLARYAARYLEEKVYPNLVAKLGYEPPDKSLFEFFNRARRTSGHGWFSVRMVGLPYIGTVGACAGKMVAMASPNDTPRKFNWARVLRHEFVHVVNLQQTDFNIPHWYTEGLAVWNEDLPRPPSWDVILARRWAADEMFDLESIDMGFLRPANGDDWTLAYCQAELYVLYMLEAHGKEAPAKMLSAYADNLTTQQAVKRSFGVERKVFEQGYRKFVGKIVAELSSSDSSKAMTFIELQKAAKENPKSADLSARLAHAFLLRGGKPQARNWALAALKLAPDHQLSAYVMARLDISIGDTKKAIDRLLDAIDEQAPQENALGLLAGLKLKSKEYADAEQLYLLGAKTFPHSDSWPKALARVYLLSEQNDKLANVLARLARLDADNFTIRKKLAQLAVQAENYRAAARWANQAIYIDVMDAETHAMWGEALVELKQYDRGIEEYETAIQLETRRSAWRLSLADACVQAKQKEKARRVLEELLQIDPGFPGAEILLESLQP